MVFTCVMVITCSVNYLSHKSQPTIACNIAEIRLKADMLGAPLSSQVPERLTSGSVCPISAEVRLGRYRPGRVGGLFTFVLRCWSACCPDLMALLPEAVLMVEVSIPSAEDKEVSECGKCKKVSRSSASGGLGLIQTCFWSSLKPGVTKRERAARMRHYSVTN